MRFPNELRLLFLLTLALVCYGGELGESSRLADEVSNDLVAVSIAVDRKCAETPSQYLVSRNGITTAKELIPYLFAIPSITPAHSSASDLLRLFSIQRK
jgi:hypothetical protein